MSVAKHTGISPNISPLTDAASGSCRARVTLTTVDQSAPPVEGLTTLEPTGIFVSCSEALPLGTIVGLRLEVLEAQPPLTFGAVARVEQILAGRGMGCRFIEVAPQGRALLSREAATSASAAPRTGSALRPPQTGPEHPIPSRGQPHARRPVAGPSTPALPQVGMWPAPPRAGRGGARRKTTVAGEISPAAAAWVPDSLHRR